MKPGTITHTIAALLSSISSLFAHSTTEKAESPKTKASKKSEKLPDDLFRNVGSLLFSPKHSASPEPGERYPWKKDIVTTVFWIGEQPSGNNPVPNRASSWDKNWTENYGGFDDPNPARRSNYIPVKFTPRQNQTPDLFAPIIGNMFLVMSVQNPISTRAPVSMFRRPCAIISD